MEYVIYVLFPFEKQTFKNIGIDQMQLSTVYMSVIVLCRESFDICIKNFRRNYKIIQTALSLWFVDWMEI